MSYPGEQVTAPPDQWWLYQSGPHSYVPVQAGFATGPDESSPAQDGHAPAARRAQAGLEGTRYAAPAGPRSAAPPGAEGRPRPRHGRPQTAAAGYPGYGSAGYASAGYADADYAAAGYAAAEQAPRGYPPAGAPAGHAADGHRRNAPAGRAGPGAAPADYAGPGAAPAGYPPARPAPGGYGHPGYALPGQPGLRPDSDSDLDAAALRTGQERHGPARGYPPRRAADPSYPPRDLPGRGEPAAASLPPGSGPWPAPVVADRASEADLTVPRPRFAELTERDFDSLAIFSDEDVDAWAASFVSKQAGPRENAPGARAAGGGAGRREPGATAPPDGVPGRTARAAGRTRAAAAQTRASTRRKVRARRRLLLGGVSVPAVAAVAAVAALALQHPGGHPAAKAPASHAGPAGAPASHGTAGVPDSHGSAAAAASHPAPALGTWQHIATRAGDPAPLTLSQLFPAQFAVGSTGYTRTAQLGSTDCRHAVFGAKLQAAVRKSGCSQVMRASYLAAAPKLMGTIGVLNLTSYAEASKVGKVTGSSEFIAQLTAPSGPTHSLTKGTGLEEAEVKGHYLILTWAEFTTHRAPKTHAQQQQLKAFSADLISHTANVSLTSRMVTGQPQVP